MTTPRRASESESEVFAELHSLVRAALGDAARQAIGSLVSALRADSPSMAAAGQLWSDVSSRIQSVQECFDEQVVARIGQNYDRKVAPDPLNESAHSEFADKLAQRIRDCDPESYARFVSALRELTVAPWSTEQTNPMAAQVTARAFVHGCEDVLAQPLAALVLQRDDVLDEVADSFARVHLSADSFLAVAVRQESVPTLPDGYDTGSDDGPGVEREPEYDVEPSQPVVQSAEPLVSDPVTDSQASQRIMSSASIQTGHSAGIPDPAPTAEAGRVAADRYTDHVASADDGARQLGQSPLASVDEGINLPIVPTLQPVLDMERDAVAFAHSIGEVPYSRTSRRRYFERARDRLGDVQTHATQMALVDLVAAMFDYVIDDRRLPDAARPLLWRLQQPALLLTLLDPAYLGDHPRSLRRLVESFGAIANVFGDDLTRGSELHRRLETIVRAVEIVSSVLHMRANILAAQVRKEYARCALSMTQLIERVDRERTTLESTPGRRNRRDYSRRPGRDEERVVTDKLNRHLAGRLQSYQVPESVRQFLEDVWLRYMRTSLLRDGEDSHEYQNATRVLDDLLWTLDQRGPKPARRELAERIPGLIDALTGGLREIGAREEDHQSFFDELFLIHLKRLQTPRDDKAARPVPKVTAPRDTLPGATVYDVGQAVPVLDEPMDLEQDSTESQESPSAVADSTQAQSTGFDSSGSASTDYDSVTGPLTEPRRPVTAVSPPAEPARVNGLTPLIELPKHHDTTIPTVILTTQIALPTTQISTIVVPASNDADMPDNALLGRLNAVDLSDLPRRPRYLRGDPVQQIWEIQPGAWMEYRMGSGKFAYLKLAWINERRTVMMMLRYPDRRALTKPVSEVQEFVRAGRIRLLRPQRSQQA